MELGTVYLKRGCIKMIPESITKQHIIDAMKEIDANGVPASREAVNWYLSYAGKHYPPKYLVSIAGKYANGKEHSHKLFSGGDEVNTFVKKLGFEIISKSVGHLEGVSNKVLLKSVGTSQHTDGVRIDKQFHDVFNPPYSSEYVPKGKVRKVKVEFNGKTFEAEYRYEGTKASNAELQRIGFYKELKDEFKAVFSQAKGFFTIRLGNDLNHFIFSYDTQGSQEYTDTLEESVDKARKDSKASRQARLAIAQQRPDTIQVTSVAYIRNADVIVEVLERASGICEKCSKDAPFKRKKDGTPYLEVHHRIPLSEGGLDTVENAIAICPNCHRELHYG